MRRRPNEEAVRADRATRCRTVLVVMLIGVWERGSGDFEPGDPGWAERYSTGVLDPFAALVTGAGAKLLWIGMPAVREVARLPRIRFDSPTNA